MSARSFSSILVGSCRKLSIVERPFPDRQVRYGSGLGVVWLIAMAALGSGCATLEKHIGTPLPVDEINGIGPGMHYRSVLERFGPPTIMSALPGGMVFQYEYVRLSERQYGLMLPGDLGKWIKAVYASANATLQVMLFVFDQEGKVRSTDSQVWRADAGGGLAVSFIFTLGTLTDTEQYEEAVARSTQWGAALTQPPLNTLNLKTNLETGANGIQLTATSTGAGQHALELGN
jgi:hypothetical protein